MWEKRRENSPFLFSFVQGSAVHGGSGWVSPAAPADVPVRIRMENAGLLFSDNDGLPKCWQVGFRYYVTDVKAMAIFDSKPVEIRCLLISLIKSLVLCNSLTWYPHTGSHKMNPVSWSTWWNVFHALGMCLQHCLAWLNTSSDVPTFSGLLFKCLSTDVV